MSQMTEDRQNDLMGRNEYARHRQCAPNAVKKAEDDGRIAEAVIRDEAGNFIGIKWRLADHLWARNTDPAEAAKNGKINRSIADEETEQDPVQAPQASRLNDVEKDVTPQLAGRAGTEDPHGYFSARADRERFQAERARLDLMERLGVLISTRDVRDEAFGIFRQLRDTLFLIGPRLSQRLATETDPMRIEQLINEQHRTVLNELSRTFAADASGGLAEREDASS